MTTTIKTGLWAFIIAASAGTAFLFAPHAEASHSWGGYHWARTTPSFTLQLGDNVNSAWDAYLAAVSADWSASSVLDTTIVAGGTNGTKGRLTPKNCSPTNGRVEVCNANYGSNGWLGLAQIWISGTHIVQGTTKLNDTYFNTSTYNTSAWRQFVMCQEVGHTFGLDHQDENFSDPNMGTCMDYTNDPARNDGAGNNVHPNTHDYEELSLIYAHLDSFNSFTTFFATKPGAASLAKADNFENASEWGKAIHTSSVGNPSLYVRDFGNGEKLFTFVIWAQ